MLPSAIDSTGLGRVSLVVCGGYHANVARLVAGAFASRLGYGFADVDDVQLAIEFVLRSLSERGARTTLELADDGGALSARLGPFEAAVVERRLAEAVDVDGPDLHGCLRRLVERVEVVGGPPAWIVLAKSRPARDA